MSLLKGISYWAKVTGDPQPGYDKSKREWSIDVTVDKEARKQLEAEGLTARIKNKDDDRGDFITFKRKEFKYNSDEKNSPIRIIDHQKAPWDGRLIGNGSEVSILYNVNESPYGLNPTILAIQVRKLEEYEGGEDPFDTYDSDGNPETWDD